MSSNKDDPTIIDLNTIEPVKCPCGYSQRAMLENHNSPCSLHKTEISSSSRTHYHKKLTEVYYFLENRGKMDLDGVLHDVKPGMVVLIPPGTRHRAIPESGAKMVVLIYVSPPFDPDDEYFD